MDERLTALFEVLSFVFTIVAVFAVIDIVVAYPYASWLKKSMMIILAVSIILVKRKYREYGLLPSKARLSIKWSFIILLVFILPAALPLIILGVVIEWFSMLLNFIWFMVFVGFAEEVAFRGYIQSRLNESFIKTYEGFIGFKVRWHEGTLIAGGLIFGPIHLFNAINFRTGEVSMDITLILIVVFASFLGILLGVIREVSGDIIVCSTLHGIIDYVAVVLLKEGVGGAFYWIPLAISFFVFFSFVFERFIIDFSEKN